MLTLLLLAAAAPQIARGTQLIDRDRADRALPDRSPRTSVRPQPRTTVAADRPASRIAGVRFVGAQAPARVAGAARGFLGRTADRATLTELAAALSAAYEGGPVALYTVAIPDQDFAGGVVLVSLTEGRIARAQLRTDDADAHPLLRRRLAPLTRETPLSRATYERQLALVTAIPGLTAGMEVTDPAADGALLLTVTPKQRRTKFTAGFSNRGVALLGDGQFDGRAEAYGLLRNGDQLSVSGSASGDLRRYRYGALGYAVPIGADGLSASASAAMLETRPRGVPLVGRAKQGGVALAYPLVRRTHQLVDINLGVDALNSDDAAFGNVLASERTRVARLAAVLVDTRSRRTVALSGSLSQGLGGLGARSSTPYARATFRKLTANASIDQAIGTRVVARVQASGQLTPDVLPAAERFAIGGDTVGRAFDTAVATGDIGGGASAELAMRPFANGRAARSEVYAFADYGGTRVLARPGLPREHQTLASAGAGVRARYRDKAELGLEAARAVRAVDVPGESGWRVSVAWRVAS